MHPRQAQAGTLTKLKKEAILCDASFSLFRLINTNLNYECAGILSINSSTLIPKPFAASVPSCASAL
jgi:hypothetical protein